LSFAIGSMQCPLHTTAGLAHLQLPPVQCSMRPHCVPQVPQLLSSVCVSVHPLAQVMRGAGQPPELVLVFVLVLEPPPCPVLVKGAPQPNACKTSSNRTAAPKL
jgi:hypothetical protein